MKLVSRSWLFGAVAVAVPSAGVVALVLAGAGDARPEPRRSVAPVTAAARPRVEATPPAQPTAVIAQPTAVAAAHDEPASGHDERALGHDEPAFGHDDHAHAPMDDRVLAATREKAAAIVARGRAEAVLGLRSPDLELASSVADLIFEDATGLAAPETVRALLELALDRGATSAARALAFDLLGRSAGVDATTLDRVALAALGSDPETRAYATGTIRALSLARSDLVAPARAALIAVSERDRDLAPDALSDLRARGATRAEVSRITAFLEDGDYNVRAAAARALGTTDAGSRASATAALERAVFRESHPDAARAALIAAVKVGRADAERLLARLADAPIVRATPELVRQVGDYRAILAGGETDPARVLAEREEREDARYRNGG